MCSLCHINLFGELTLNSLSVRGRMYNFLQESPGRLEEVRRSHLPISLSSSYSRSILSANTYCIMLRGEWVCLSIYINYERVWQSQMKRKCIKYVLIQETHLLHKSKKFCFILVRTFVLMWIYVCLVPQKKKKKKLQLNTKHIPPAARLRLAVCLIKPLLRCRVKVG